jgi:hypothetical protein
MGKLNSKIFGWCWFLVLGAADVTAAQHQFGDLIVTVLADATDVGYSPEYQVTVANSELMLTRLSAPFEGTLSNSFVADLDKDGDFEVVVTFTHADGLSTEVRIFSWNGALLEPIKISDLDANQRLGYNGGDEYAVSNGELIRMFQIYDNKNGQLSASATRRRLRYSFATAKWTE